MEGKKENGTDRLLDTCYHSAVYNNSDGSYTVVIQEYECVVATHDGGSGGGLDEGAGGGSSTCDQQLLPTEDCPGAGNTDDCPLYCGGGGGTGDGGNSSFMGAIGIDTQELDKFPKLKCTVDRVLDTSNMQDLIAEFGMSYTNYDLIFSGAPILEDNDGEFLGGLDVIEKVNANDQFILLANNNMAQDRSSVEIAITYLHEAIHAEMRRYLLDNADTSTLPNFPGSITEDWVNFVAERNKPDAEHHAMGYTEYIDFIAQAASDFDDGQMPFSYYQGLAWVGIYDKDHEGWKNAPEAYKSRIRKGYKNAKEELKSRSNDICN